MARLDQATSARPGARWTRRGFIGRSVGLAVALAAPAAIVGCASSPATPTAAPATSAVATPTTAAAASAVATPTAAAAPSAPAAPTEKPTAAVGQPKKGGVLRIAYPGAIFDLDPAHQLTVEVEDYTGWVYDNLVRRDQELKLYPMLATSWQSSEDLKSWTFKLREGVKFHHGKIFNADDVVYSFTRILDPKTASPFRSVLDFIQGVEKQDDYTAVFYLKQSYADFPTVLSGYPSRIVPSDYSEEQLVKDASGTGPFKLKEWRSGESLSVVRNDGYWDSGLPYLDEVRQVMLPEATSRTAAMSAGQIDVIWRVYPETLAVVEADPKIVVSQTRSGGYVPIVMRCDMPPFDDIRVRQAMKWVVDREQMRDVALLGLGDLGNDQPIPPANPLFTDIGLRKRDVDKAKQLLKDAGHADGLTLTLYASPGRPGMVEQAVALKEMAAPAGIKIDIQKIPIDAYWADYWMKKEFTFSNWFMTPTADEHLSIAYKSDAKWNEAFFKSEKLDKLIIDARGETDRAKRKAIYAEAETLISEEGGSIITFFQPVISATSKAVRNFRADSVGFIFPRDIWLDQS